MSAAIAGPASIAASPTLPSKNFFIVGPPRFPVKMPNSTARRGAMSVTLRQHLLKFGPQKNHTPEYEDWCARAYRGSLMELECLANLRLPNLSGHFPPANGRQGPMKLARSEARRLRIRSINMSLI